MSVSLKSACRGKEDDPKFGRDSVLVLIYEVKHSVSDAKNRRGSILTLNVVVRIDESTRETKAEVHITDCPPLADVPAALAKLGEWCARLGEKLQIATNTPTHAMVPARMERKQ